MGHRQGILEEKLNFLMLNRDTVRAKFPVHFPAHVKNSGLVQDRSMQKSVQEIAPYTFERNVGNVQDFRPTIAGNSTFLPVELG